MKKITYIWMTLCLVALCGCGTTDVWQKWESEGTPNPNRLKPSEIKDVLCSADGWKLNYKGHDFYFQFFDDGTVVANSDNTIEEATTHTSYHFNAQDDKVVALKIDGGGHLSALTEGSEDTYLISGIQDNKITATGAKVGTEMNMTAITTAELDSQLEAKAALLLRLNMKKKGFMNGVIRNTDGTFAAHYAISFTENKIRFITLENRVAVHQEADLSVNENEFSFSGIKLNEQAVTKLTYENAGEGSAKLEGAYGMKVTSNKDGASSYTGGSFKTYKISKNSNLGDAKEELWQEIGWSSIGDIEVSDRAERPLVICPGKEDAVWYTFFDANWSVKDELDRLYFRKTSGYMPFGGANRIAEVEQKLAKFLGAWFHSDGLYVVSETVDSKSYLYFFSPTTDNWLKVEK